MLFGSVARGEASAESDLDLMIVRPRATDADGDVWRTQLIDLERSVTAWTGNDTRIVAYGEDELTGLAEEPLFGDVLEDGIELVGTRRALKRSLAESRTG
jgi:predicted nucleotidyltransferase